MRKITSREYKLTLNVDDKLYQDWDRYKFNQLLKIIQYAAMQTKVQCSGKFKPSDQFTVQYLDTPEQDLYKNGWIFRYREYPPTNKYPHEHTLKFRSGDRYYSATKNIEFDPSSITSTDSQSMMIYNKFEEDITITPFSSNFSPSTNVYSKHNTVSQYDTFGKLTEVFPGLNECQQHTYINQSTPIVPVRGKKVIQEVWKGLTVKLGDVNAKLKIVLWWEPHTKDRRSLLFGEIMFRLKEPKEKFSGSTIIDAHNFYLKLNEIGLNTGWFNSDGGMTKTKHFYNI